jgi:hypothetical protein
VPHSLGHKDNLEHKDSPGRKARAARALPCRPVAYDFPKSGTKPSICEVDASNIGENQAESGDFARLRARFIAKTTHFVHFVPDFEK